MNISTDSQLQTALTAVRASARVTRAVQQQMVDQDTMQKKDRSPVTVADFASQAVVCAMLQAAGDDTPMVGEEDAHELRQDAQAQLRQAVVRHVGAALGRDADEAQVLGWIDRGNSEPGQRYWTLDPIDGTKGFLRNEQYAIALGLIENGKVTLGIMGCPNLHTPGGGTGALFYARRGQGAFVLNLWDDNDTSAQPVTVSDAQDPSAARFCESVESGHSDQSQSAMIAKALGITTPPVRMDSQAKYGVVARGEASIYLRLPTRADYVENIWDHAAGMIVVEEAGGTVTDVDGKPLDFSHGAKLAANRGVVATNGPIHAQVVSAVRGVLSA